MLLFITLQMVFLTCDRCVEFHAQVCLTYRAQEKNKKERKKERKKEKNLTFCLSCKLTLGKYMWLSYYHLLPGSHSLFIILFEDDVPEPLPSPVFLLEIFLGPARKSAHPGLLPDETFFMSLYIMLKF